MRQCFRARTELIRDEIERRKPHRDAYFTKDCIFDSRTGAIEQSEEETVLSCAEADGTMTVITSGVAVPEGHRTRMRYMLTSVPNGWRIGRVQWECHMCKATGKRNDKTCVACHGKGWWP